MDVIDSGQGVADRESKMRMAELHADFRAWPGYRAQDWRLTNWSSAIRIALGGKALFQFRTAFTVLLAPSVLLAAYSLCSQRPMFLVWAFFSLWGFLTSSPGPTAIGMAASSVIAVVGFILSLIRHDGLLAFTSLLPGATWMGSCAIRGVTATYLIEALAASEPTFEMLVSHGILNGQRITPLPPSLPEPQKASRSSDREPSQGNKGESGDRNASCPESS